MTRQENKPTLFMTWKLQLVGTTDTSELRILALQAVQSAKADIGPTFVNADLKRVDGKGGTLSKDHFEIQWPIQENKLFEEKLMEHFAKQGLKLSGFGNTEWITVQKAEKRNATTTETDSIATVKTAIEKAETSNKAAVHRAKTVYKDLKNLPTNTAFIENIKKPSAELPLQGQFDKTTLAEADIRQGHVTKQVSKDNHKSTTQLAADPNFVERLHAEHNRSQQGPNPTLMY